MENKKNYWVIPTDKPSRLFLNKINNKLLLEDISNPSLKNVLPSGSYQNIYITNDEEIKEGDWCFEVHNGDSKATAPNFTDEKGNKWWLRKANANDIAGCPTTKKIILTTDQDLIKDGVQAIDDEFLEWFVKNPSCIKVDVDKYLAFGGGYQIIIPKEELCPLCNNNKLIDGVCKECTELLCKPFSVLENQETLEEAAVIYAHKSFIWPLNKQGEKQSIPPGQLVPPGYTKHQKVATKHFTAGYKLAQEISYSEEELKQFAFECVANFLSNNDNKVEIKLVDVIIDRVNNKFEQFKKK